MSQIEKCNPSCRMDKRKGGFIIDSFNISEGEFIHHPHNYSIPNINVRYCATVVRIKMDGCWFKILLKKQEGENQWNIGFCDIQALNPEGIGYISLPFQKRQRLVNEILNFNKFRLVFLFV